MNIPGFTTKTLLEFHEKVIECLRKDDENPLTEKEYGVRTFRDWRAFSDAIEGELRTRNVPFTSVSW
jgi:hypothetical protein